MCIICINQKPYFSANRQSLFNILQEFNFSDKLIQLIEVILQNTEVKVKIESEIAATVNIDLRQGDALSPILFNLLLEKVIREMNINNRRVVWGNSNINILAYADDIVILGDTEEAVKQVCGKLIAMVGKVSLNINDKTSEYMIINRQGKNINKDSV